MALKVGSKRGPSKVPEHEGPPDHVVERIDEALKYNPSDEGMLLARLYDGEARVPWEPPPFDTEANRAEGGWVEAADLARGGELLALIVDAFTTGDREVLARLDAAARLLRGDPKTEDERLARYVDAIEQMARRMRRDLLTAVQRSRRIQGLHDEDEKRLLRHSHRLHRDALARWHDAAFARLEPRRLYEAVLKIEMDDLKRKKGGRSAKGAAHIGAELAVEVNAFGAADVEAFKARLQVARTRARKI